MGLVSQILLLLSLATLLSVVGSQPSKDTKSETIPFRSLLAHTRLSGLEDFFRADRKLLQKDKGAPKGPKKEETQRPATPTAFTILNSKVCENDTEAKDNIMFWDELQMGFLFVPDWPRSCGDLNKIDLTSCAIDINTKNGCCSAECLNVLEQMTPECWKDFAKEMCAEGLKKEVKQMDGLGRRCLTELGPFSCKDCSLPQKKKAKQSLEKELANIALVEEPEVCVDFASLDMLMCENDLEVEDGCCEDPCLNLLDEMSDECWMAFNANACASDSTSKLVQIMDALSKRCDTVHRPVQCKNKKIITPLDGSSKESELFAEAPGPSEDTEGFAEPPSAPEEKEKKRKKDSPPSPDKETPDKDTPVIQQFVFVIDEGNNETRQINVTLSIG